MSNIAMKIIKPHILKKYDRCVACGKKRVLKKHKGFWYCAECLEDENKLDAIVDYYTDFSEENNQ